MTAKHLRRTMCCMAPNTGNGKLMSFVVMRAAKLNKSQRLEEFSFATKF